MKRSLFLNSSEKIMENTKQTGINKREGDGDESEKEEELEDPAKLNTSRKERKMHARSCLIIFPSSLLRTIKYA
jgi:hypothetical protein